jgi:hypothetical protein
MARSLFVRISAVVLFGSLFMCGTAGAEPIQQLSGETGPFTLTSDAGVVQLDFTGPGSVVEINGTNTSETIEASFGSRVFSNFEPNVFGGYTSFNIAPPSAPDVLSTDLGSAAFEIDNAAAFIFNNRLVVAGQAFPISNATGLDFGGSFLEHAAFELTLDFDSLIDLESFLANGGQITGAGLFTEGFVYQVAPVPEPAALITWVVGAFLALKWYRHRTRHASI